MQHFIGNPVLAAIVCGFEGGGTTMLSEILRQHPNLSSGFEGGVLLAESPSKFLTIEPYYSNLRELWSLSNEDMLYIFSANNWLEVYERLRNRSPVIKDKSAYLFDKTPRYMAYLPEILEKVCNVPCIVLVRDPRAILWTRTKRTYENAPPELSIEKWAEQEREDTIHAYLAHAEGWERAIQSGFESRILLVQYEHLCINQEVEAKKIFDFLGFDFEKSYLSFRNKDPRYHPCRGEDVSIHYLTEYKENLSNESCEKILFMTQKFQDWWYLSN